MPPADSQSRSPTPEDSARAKWLRDEIHRHNRLYHGRDEQEIPDTDYDALFRELRELEEAHPELATPDSPTQLVGAPSSGKFSPVEHGAPMLSLDNVFNRGEMEEFDRKLGERLPAETELEYAAEPKLDGVALSLMYRRGRLVRAATRGDGRVGEDVTHTASIIGSIPHRLSGADAPERLDVRGEVFMPLSEFDAYNERAEKEGDKQLVNPRNAAAGALRQKDPALAARRSLDFFAHGVAHTDDVPRILRQSDLLRSLESWGLKVCPASKSVSGAEGCARYYEWISRKRDAFDYALDGVVYKLQRFDLREQAGASSRAPRWAVARKFPAEEKLATVRAIEYQVGRTGALTPVARLEPVFVGGATVSNATLHNYRELLRKDVRAGDTVVVRRAGDVIPEVVRSLPDRRTGDTPPPVLPESCPECGSKAVLPEDEPVVRCTGGLKCPAQRKARILHFASRHAMDIEGLGEQRVEQLLNAGLIEDLPDIFRLEHHEDELANLTSEDPIGAELAGKLLHAIDTSRETTLDRFINGLNIPGVGPKTASRLGERFKGLLPLVDADPARLQETEGVSEAAAERICSFFRREANRRTISGLIDVGVNWPNEEIVQLGQRAPSAAHTSHQSFDADENGEAPERPGSESPERLKTAIRRLADRNSLNIGPMGFDWIGEVVDRGFVREAHEIFRLELERIEELTIRRTLGRKSAKNLLDGIEKAKGTTLERFIYSLGIRDVGRVTAGALAQHFGSLDALGTATEEQLCEVPDVGEVVSRHLREFFSKAGNVELVQAMRANGVEWSESDATPTAPEGRLQGKSFVLTGTLEGMTRDVARQRILAAGGRVVGSVSKKTNYLVYGEKPGSKRAKAEKLGVETIDQEKFLAMLDQAREPRPV